MPTHTPQAKDLEEIQVKTKTASLQKHKSTDEIRLKGFDFNKKKLNKFNIIEESKASSPSNKIQQANTSNEPKLYYDQSDIKKFIEKENISIIVDNFNLNIDILKSNQNVIEFKIEKLCLENFPDKTFHGLKSRLDIVDLLKIKSLSFRTTIQAKLNIEDVNIRYISGAIEFSINKIGFLSRSNEVPDIFAFKPEEGKQKNNHAIMMKIYFSSRLVEKIEVHLAPLQLCISDQEISTEISSISLINKLFASEETSYPKILEKEMFKGKFFDYVVKKMEQFKKEINDPVLISSTTPSHLGLLEANEDSKLIINCDKIYLQCRVGKTGFCKIKLSNLNFEQASDSNFKLDFDIISFEPHDTAYKNVFMSTRKDTPLRLSVRYANDYPEIVIKDAKLTYIARAIKELTLFNKEIKAKILENSDDLQERMNEKVGKLDSKAEEVVKEEPFLGIKIINSCLIIPRDSKSPDIFVGNFDEVEAKISN